MAAKISKYIKIVLTKKDNVFIGAFNNKRLAQLYCDKHNDCYMLIAQIDNMALFNQNDNK